MAAPQVDLVSKFVFVVFFKKFFILKANIVHRTALLLSREKNNSFADTDKAELAKCRKKLRRALDDHLEEECDTEDPQLSDLSSSSSSALSSLTSSGSESDLVSIAANGQEKRDEEILYSPVTVTQEKEDERQAIDSKENKKREGNLEYYEMEDQVPPKAKPKDTTNVYADIPKHLELQILGEGNNTSAADTVDTFAIPKGENIYADIPQHLENQILSDSLKADDHDSIYTDASTDFERSCTEERAASPVNDSDTIFYGDSNGPHHTLRAASTPCYAGETTDSVYSDCTTSLTPGNTEQQSSSDSGESIVSGEEGDGETTPPSSRPISVADVTPHGSYVKIESALPHEKSDRTYAGKFNCLFFPHTQRIFD